MLTDPCADLQKNPVDGFSAGLVDDENMLEWQIVIMGYVLPAFASPFSAKFASRDSYPFGLPVEPAEEASCADPTDQLTRYMRVPF